MPYLNVAFAGDAPMIDMLISVSQQRRDALLLAKQPIPPTQRARSLIDTGASGTCIGPFVLAPLNLMPTGAIPIHTPSTSGVPLLCEQYDVGLGIAHPTDPMVMLTVPVIATRLRSQGIDALVGRDVLSRCLLIYDGTAQRFTFAF